MNINERAEQLYHDTACTNNELQEITVIEQALRDLVGAAAEIAESEFRDDLPMYQQAAENGREIAQAIRKKLLGD